MNISLNDIDDLKNHLETAISAKIDQRLDQITGIVGGFSGRVQAVEKAQESQAGKVAGLEKNQAKALAAWTVMIGLIATGFTLLFAQIKSWVTSHFHN